MIEGPSIPQDLATKIRDLSEVLIGGADPGSALLRIAEVAMHALPRATGVGINQVHGERWESVASTSGEAHDFDRAQYAAAQGPSFDALNDQKTVEVDDLATDPRWPDLRGPVAHMGIRSILAQVLATGDGVVGTMNVYSTSPSAFDDQDRAAAVLLSTQAALLLARKDDRQKSEARVAQLEDALHSRDVIGQAKGILMEREACSADEAFEMLRTASQHLNRKLREIAGEVISDAKRKRDQRY
jgi:GAF domain-containing protein